MSSKIRVMHIVLSMHFGGLEGIVNKIVKKIDREKFLSYVCCLDDGGELLDDLPEHYAKKYVFARKPGKLDFALLVKLIGVIRREGIDIIHSHSGCTFYSAIAGRLGRVRGIIHTDHGRLTPDKKGLILEDRIFSRFMDRFVGVTEDLTAYLKNRVGVPSQKLATITNGVDTEIFKPLSRDKIDSIKTNLGIKSDSRVIGVVCRLENVKNIPFLLRTIANMLRERDYVLLLVGEGMARGEIEKTILELELRNSVILLGQRSDIPLLMSLFDVFVLPSISEGTSMTILEAMACGVPVVASNVGGNPKLIQDGVTGFLFDLKRPDILKQSIHKILTDTSIATSFGRAGRKRVETMFSFEKMLNSYTQIYLELCHVKDV